MHYRFYTLLLIVVCLLGGNTQGIAQETKSESNTPVILYSGSPKKYEIAGIEVKGVTGYEDYVLIGLSGLTVGQLISVPGDDITQAIKRYWKHGLFSDVSIKASKIEGKKIYLEIDLKQRARISSLTFHGIKKSEKEDLTAKLGLIKGSQITPNLIDRAKIVIKRYFDDKGFKNAIIDIVQKDDISAENQMIVEINIDKKTKIKIQEITFKGNEALSTSKLMWAMKKTNATFSNKHLLRSFKHLFRTKKFIDDKYQEDKQLIIDKYNELGYRDARIVRDSVWAYNEKKVNVYLEIEEGAKYYLRNISWIGNTLYPTETLEQMLVMKKGDVYNQKKLAERTSSDPDAVGNLYYNNGYVFFRLDPVEVNVVNDSIDLELRMTEGPQASINKVIINGNERVYENVVRRELRTRPGALFSKDDLERSYREIAQMGHFDPENIKPDVRPDATNGTVDIAWDLASKSSDQVEFSAGWGQTGILGRIGLKFSNFSFKNLFKPGENRKAFLPQGDGQTLSLNGQTNGTYYQSYSVSFLEPWFGGKRPNSLSVSAYYSKQTDVNSSYYNSNYTSNYNTSMYGGSSSYDYSNAYDPDKSVQMYGVSLGWGKRLTWPDDYFTFSTELSFQRYILKNWSYFPVNNGKSNNFSIGLNLSRSSIDNPIFTRRGSQFTLSVNFTPPYSWFDGKDYSKKVTTAAEQDEKFRWVEYHKWKFKSKTFTPLSNWNKTPVLMTRAEWGFLGHYNSNKRSPFETFYMGGDGMTGYSSSYATETIALRGYENGSLTPYGQEGYAYSRLGAELRFPLMLEASTNIYVLGFMEAGNAWSSVKNFNPFDLKRSAGFGVRIFLPMIGMMGLDWAYGFDKVFGSSQYGGSQLHFILGQEF